MQTIDEPTSDDERAVAANLPRVAMMILPKVFTIGVEHWPSSILFVSFTAPFVNFFSFSPICIGDIINKDV